jgi:hypothetical protein
MISQLRRSAKLCAGDCLGEHSACVGAATQPGSAPATGGSHAQNAQQGDKRDPDAPGSALKVPSHASMIFAQGGTFADAVETLGFAMKHGRWAPATTSRAMAQLPICRPGDVSCYRWARLVVPGGWRR